MAIRYRGGDILDFRGDLVILGHFADARPLTGALGRFDWRNCAAVSRLWKAREGTFEFGRLTLVPSQGKIPSSGVLIAGLGKRQDFSADLRREVHRLSLEAAGRMGARNVAAEVLAVQADSRMAPVEGFRQAVEEVGGNALGGIVLYIQDPGLLSSLRPGPEPEAAEERAASAAGN